MNKSELITNIIEICDKAEQYERTMLERAFDTSKATEGGSSLSIVDEVALSIGRQKIVEDALYYYRGVNVSKDEEINVLDVQTYESWVKQYVKNIPEYISRRDFVVDFEKELRTIYEEERDNALEDFKEE